MRWLVALLTAVNILGCTTIDMNSKIEDWPNLTVTEHFGTTQEMREACSKYVGGFETPLACTEWDFDEARTDSYYEENPPQWILDHERLHQKGYDHPNSTYLKKLWEEWKEEHRRKHAPSN